MLILTLEIVIAVALMGIAGLTLHKVRRIHLATYGLSASILAVRRGTDALFRQLQALLALERKLKLDDALPPMRGRAGSPDFLVVAKHIDRAKPNVVLECGAGVSTLVCAKILQKLGNGRVFSIEHDAR